MAEAMPTFTFTPGSDDQWQTVIDGVFRVMLWGDDSEFDTFAAWAAVDANSPTTNQYENSTGYSGYVLSFECAVNTATSTNYDGAGCCLKDNDILEGGGYCVLYDYAGATGNTYFLTEEQFVTAESTDYSIASSLQVAISETNEVGFEVFQCTLATTTLTCSKF